MKDVMEGIHAFGPGVEIRFEQETEVIESWFGVNKPDPSWREVDSEGHIHAWINDKLPTLEKVQIGTEWIGDDRDAEEVPVYQHQCKVCGAVVIPKEIVDRSPQYVRGPSAYFLVFPPTMMRSEWRIPEEDVGPLIEIFQRMFVDPTR